MREVRHGEEEGSAGVRSAQTREDDRGRCRCSKGTRRQGEQGEVTGPPGCNGKQPPTTPPQSRFLSPGGRGLASRSAPLPRDRPGRTEYNSARGDRGSTPSVPALPAPSHSHGSPARLAVISDGVYQGQPVTRVIYGEGGFTLLDAEMQDENPEDHGVEEFHAVCLDCVIEWHPEAGQGMDIAKRAGSSRFHLGVWMEEMP